MKVKVWTWRGRLTGRVFWAWKCPRHGHAIVTGSESAMDVIDRAVRHADRCGHV